MLTNRELPITISLPQGFTIGGVTTWALSTARRFAEKDRQVRLVAHPPLAGHATFDPAPFVDHANVAIVNAPAMTSPAAIDACTDCYRKLLPMVLLPNLCAASYAIAAALSRSCAGDMKVVSWVHGDNPVDYAYLEYAEPVVHRYVAVSRKCQAEMKARLPARADDVEYIPYGIEIPEPTNRTTIQNRPLRIVYAGRMEQGVKRVMDVLAIGRMLLNANVQFELRLVGDGPHTQLIDARIKALAPHFASHGCSISREAPCPPEKMLNVWRWADVSILASRLEGFSVAMLEAMAAGCVPVVSRVESGVGDIIRDQHNGMSFPVGDLDAATQCLQQIALDAELAAAMSSNARASAIANVSMDVYMQRVESVLTAADALEPRIWPSTRPMLMPPTGESFIARTRNEQSSEYEAVIDFVMSRPDATRIIIYGLGVNGLSLVEQLRADPYLGDRELIGLDDHAHPAIFDTMQLPRTTLVSDEPWPGDTIAIVTPNEPASMVRRLVEHGACDGVDFTCLRTSIGDEAAFVAEDSMPC